MERREEAKAILVISQQIARKKKTCKVQLMGQIAIIELQVCTATATVQRILYPNNDEFLRVCVKRHEVFDCVLERQSAVSSIRGETAYTAEPRLKCLQ